VFPALYMKGPAFKAQEIFFSVLTAWTSMKRMAQSKNDLSATFRKEKLD